MNAHSQLISRILSEHGAVVAPPLLPELRLHQGTALVDVWGAAEEGLGAEVEAPFWAWHWPGGQGIARYLLDHPSRVRGRRVLDLACGGGVAAVAAATLGAEVYANDLDPLALAAAALNARLNGVELTPLPGDLLAGGAPPALGVDVVLVGDAFYSAPFAAALVPWLQAGRALGWDILVGDGGRAFLPDVGLDEVARFEVAVPQDLEGVPFRAARVLTWP